MPKPDLNSDERKWVELTGFVKWDELGENSSIEGRYLGYVRPVRRMDNGTFEEAKFGQYTILTAEGPKRFNETYELDNLKVIPPGVYIKVVHIGMVKSASDASRRVRVFRLFVDAEEYDDQLQQEIVGAVKYAILPGRVEAGAVLDQIGPAMSHEEASRLRVQEAAEARSAELART